MGACSETCSSDAGYCRSVNAGAWYAKRTTWWPLICLNWSFGWIVGHPEVSAYRHAAVLCPKLCVFVRPTRDSCDLCESGELKNQQLICFQSVLESRPDTKNEDNSLKNS